MLKRTLNRALSLNSGTSDINNEASEVDITPMLDVVFIMLIFFIVTASFVRESGIELNKPDAVSSSQAPEQRPIVVEIDRHNEIRIQNIVVSSNAIKSTIVRLRAESPEAAVVIRLHPDSNTAAMVAAVDGIRSANVPFPSVDLIRG